MTPIATVTTTFTAPAIGLPAAADERRFWLPLILMTVLTIGTSLVMVPKIDFHTMIAAGMQGMADKMSPHEQSEAIATAVKLGKIWAYAWSAAGPAVMVLICSFFFWMAFKVAGGTPPFGSSFSVMSHALLPQTLKGLLFLPAILRRDTLLDPKSIDWLLPSHLGVLLPAGTTGPLAAVLTSIDIFNVWSLALIAIGMAHAAKTSRARATVTTVALFLAYIGFKVATSALGQGK